jgi:hypothetical protein
VPRRAGSAAAGTVTPRHEEGRMEGEAPEDSRTWRSLLLEATVVVVAAAAAAITTTWPLVLHLGDMAENATDSLFQAWTIDHVQWAVTGHGSLYDANIFSPNKHTLAYSDTLLGLAIPLLVLRWAGLGPVAQLNVALLLGLTASAAAGYLFGRVVSGRWEVGVLTGAAFSFGPYQAVSIPHVHAVTHPGVALAATGTWWVADRVARGERGRQLQGPLVLVVLAVVWQVSMSVYPGSYAVGAVLLVALVRWRDLGARGAAALGGALAVCAAAALVLALPYLAVLREGRNFVQSIDEVAILGADFLRAAPNLTIWGGHLGNDYLPPPAFPGATLLVLGVWGAVAGWRAGGRRRRTVVTALVFLAVGAFLALGTAGEGWRAWSPYRLLFEHVPIFRSLRAAYRSWVIGLLGLGLLAGEGAVSAGRVLRRIGGTRIVAVVAVLAGVAVVAEGHESWADRPHVSVSRVDRALAKDPRPGGVLYLPMLLPADDPASFAASYEQAQNVFGTTAHHRRTPNGYSGIVPKEFVTRSARMRSLPSAATLRELRDIDVRFVVVRASARGTVWEPLLDPARAAPLELVGRYGDDLLYRVPDEE